MRQEPRVLSRRALLRQGGLFAGGAGLFGLAACGGSSGAAGSSGKGYKGELAIVHLQVLVQGAPHYIAQAKGYYKNEGLHFKLVDLGGGTEVVRAVVQTAQMGMSAAIGALAGYSKGLGNLRLVAGLYNQPSEILLTTSDSSLTLDNLRGKKIATSRADSLTTFYADLIARKQNLRPGKDMKIVFAGDSPARWTALQKGLVDAAVIGPLYSTKLVESGKAKTLVKVADLAPNFPENVLIATQDFIDSDGDVVRGWVRATQRAIKDIKQNTEDAAKVWAKAAKLDPGVALAALKENKDGFSTTIPRAGLKQSVAAGRQLGLVKGTPSLQGLIDDEFVG